MPTREEVIKANLELSRTLAPTYKELEPHYRPENKKVVIETLTTLRYETGGGNRLLDLGCGAGFILDLAKLIFPEVWGVDISPEMLALVDKSRVRGLVNCPTDATPFEDGFFNVVTAYAVLHHLNAIKPTLKEAYRVLKPGGAFYSALDPNKAYYNRISSLEPSTRMGPLVEREVSKLKEEASNPLHAKAEPEKYSWGGFKPSNLRLLLSSVGFKNIKVTPYWVLGEASLVGKPFHKELLDYLKSLLPMSLPLFKYLEVVAIK